MTTAELLPKMLQACAFICMCHMRMHVTWPAVSNQHALWDSNPALELQSSGSHARKPLSSHIVRWILLGTTGSSGRIPPLNPPPLRLSVLCGPKQILY